MNLSRDAKIVCGFIMLTVPTIEYGGTFMLALLSGGHSELGLTDFQRAMFRAGHAHAGVLVLLSLIAQMLLDELTFARRWVRALRALFVLAPLFVSGGFFAAAAEPGAIAPSGLVALIYVGAALLAVALVGAGAGLLRARGAA